MRKLIVRNVMSLDGCYTGPGSDIMALARRSAGPSTRIACYSDSRGNVLFPARGNGSRSRREDSHAHGHVQRRHTHRL
jgi:hypothetical protein